MRQAPAYDRTEAVRYARRWALGRNPAFGDFSGLGGDCANFVSQCLWAGWHEEMAPQWYYRSMRERTPSWSGVRFLRRWLLEAGRAEVCDLGEAEAGDVIFLWDGSRWHHSLVITLPGPDPLVAAHTHDVLNRPLSDYAVSAREAVHVL